MTAYSYVGLMWSLFIIGTYLSGKVVGAIVGISNSTNNFICWFELRIDSFYQQWQIDKILISRIINEVMMGKCKGPQTFTLAHKSCKLEVELKPCVV